MLIVMASACRSDPSGPAATSSTEGATAGQASRSAAAQAELLIPDGIRPGSTLPASIPRQTLIVALTRWASTTIAAVDPASGEFTPILTRPTGEWQSASAGGRLAFLLREGVNPSKNVLEIWDLHQGWTKILTPARTLAVVGFGFDPSAAQLVLAEMSLSGSSSRRLQWRTTVVDLETNDARVLQASSGGGFAENVLPVPLGWSAATGALLFQGVSPLRGMLTQGVWMTSPRDASFQSLLPEAAYTGVPQLSPDGRYLAHLDTNLDALPAEYVPSPGASPGNLLVVSHLLTGERTARAGDAGTTFGPLAWAASGREFVVSRREWRNGRFRDVGFLRVRADDEFKLTAVDSAPAALVTDIAACTDGAIQWVERDAAGATLRSVNTTHSERVLLTLPNGQIQLVGCRGE